MLETWAPPQLLTYDWDTNPMQRCTQTARHLTGRTVATNDLLKETFGGDWQGETLKGLRARFGDEMAGRENLGWDFRAPGGESPRDVAERLKTLTYGESGRVRPADSGGGSPGCDPMCFCLEIGWNCLGKLPFAVERPAAQLF